MEGERIENLAFMYGMQTGHIIWAISELESLLQVVDYDSKNVRDTESTFVKSKVERVLKVLSESNRRD